MPNTCFPIYSREDENESISEARGRRRRGEEEEEEKEKHFPPFWKVYPSTPLIEVTDLFNFRKEKIQILKLKCSIAPCTVSFIQKHPGNNGFSLQNISYIP